MLELPAGLVRLIDAGIWPSGEARCLFAQQTRPLVRADRVHLFAAEESLICLYSPPFSTIAETVASGGFSDFWKRFGALEQIVPEQALIIADFGLGADSVVILAFDRDALNPPVLRLHWGQDRRNEWVEGARDFEEFAQMLGLTKDTLPKSGANPPGHANS